nr:hypothetical protein CFP56_16858 [Quercus suber]
MNGSGQLGLTLSTWPHMVLHTLFTISSSVVLRQVEERVVLRPTRNCPLKTPGPKSSGQGLVGQLQHLLRLSRHRAWMTLPLKMPCLEIVAVADPSASACVARHTPSHATARHSRTSTANRGCIYLYLPTVQRAFTGVSMFSRYPALAAAFLSLAAAQTTSPTSTSSTALASLWLPLDLDAVGAYAASVVNLCSDATTYQLSCSGDCVPYAPAFTVTAHSNEVRVNYQTTTDGILLSLSESCSIASSTSASCSATASASGPGGQSAFATSAVYPSDIYDGFSYQIPVTAGADKISKGTCTAGAVHAAAPVLFGAAAVGVLAAAIML